MPSLARPVLVLAAFLFAVLAVAVTHNYIAGERFRSDTCISSEMRMKDVIKYWETRAALEEQASKRGYTTTPEWSGLAAIDREHVADLKRDYNKSCPVVYIP